MQKILAKKINAVSLAEVLVVLAIVAVTLVSISQLTVRLLVTIKNDEVLDYTTAISLQTLEIAKNAADIELVSTTPITQPDGQYKIDFTTTPASLYRVSPANNGATITNCTETSTYYIQVDVPEVGNQPLVCMQILIDSSQDSLRQDYYLLTAVTVTKLADDIRITQFKGYRRGAFEITNSSDERIPATPPPPATSAPGSSNYEECYPYGERTELCCTYENNEVSTCETKLL